MYSNENQFTIKLFIKIHSNIFFISQSIKKQLNINCFTYKMILYNIALFASIENSKKIIFEKFVSSRNSLIEIILKNYVELKLRVTSNVIYLFLILVKSSEDVVNEFQTIIVHRLIDIMLKKNHIDFDINFIIRNCSMKYNFLYFVDMNQNHWIIFVFTNIHNYIFSSSIKTSQRI